MRHVKEDDPHLSTRQMSRELAIYKKSATKILHDNEFHPHRVRLVLELSDEEHDGRKEFAELLWENVMIQTIQIF